MLFGAEIHVKVARRAGPLRTRRSSEVQWRMPYPEMFVAPMRQELTRFGVKELRTAEAVDAAVTGTAGTLMIVVNSVCGCAAGKARPGVAMALRHAHASGRGRNRIRGRRHRGDRARTQLLHRLRAVVAFDRAVQGRQARVHARAEPDREPQGGADRRRRSPPPSRNSAARLFPPSAEPTCHLTVLPSPRNRRRKSRPAALAEARANNWTMAAAIVDPSGILVYFEKIDDTQHASAQNRDRQGPFGRDVQAADEDLPGLGRNAAASASAS